MDYNHEMLINILPYLISVNFVYHFYYYYILHQKVYLNYL